MGIRVSEIQWNTRPAVSIENDLIQIVFLPGGGHIAALVDKTSGVNPLWQPKWTPCECADYNPEQLDSEYGGPTAGRLLAAIAGHNICLDYFGDPTGADLAAGLTVHGEAPVCTWNTESRDNGIIAEVQLPIARLTAIRNVFLQPGSRIVRFKTEVINTGSDNRDIGWAEHVTLGEPFLAKGTTCCNMPAVWGRTYHAGFGTDLRLKPDTDFMWPEFPAAAGGSIDGRFAPAEEKSGDFTTQLMNPESAQAWFTAWNPRMQVLMGYVWNRADYPWIGNWEENHARQVLPWAGKEYCRGMEFSTSPFPAGRDAAVNPGTLQNIPTYRSIPAGGSIVNEFAAFVLPESRAGETVDRVEDTGQSIEVSCEGESLCIH